MKNLIFFDKLYQFINNLDKQYKLHLSVKFQSIGIKYKDLTLHTEN